MAFMISKIQQPFAESEKLSLSEGRDENESLNSVTSHLYLKSSSSSSAQARTAGALDKDVVLRRIRHHKHLKKVQTTVQALQQQGSYSSEHRWLEHDDAF